MRKKKIKYLILICIFGRQFLDGSEEVFYQKKFRIPGKSLTQIKGKD
jgi:hypothetical protein